MCLEDKLLRFKDRCWGQKLPRATARADAPTHLLHSWGRGVMGQPRGLCHFSPEVHHRLGQSLVLSLVSCTLGKPRQPRTSTPVTCYLPVSLPPQGHSEPHGPWYMSRRTHFSR
jgi:hypothetical protein